MALDRKLIDKLLADYKMPEDLIRKQSTNACKVLFN